jgi:bifunctional non-homologous end joining protein LigD
MAATPWPEPFQDEHWRYELKWDGVRALLANPRHGEMVLTSRRGNVINGRYPELTRLGLPPDIVLDGEIVALDDAGRPSFERLQGRMNLSSARLIASAVEQIPISYVVFDLLYDGADITAMPLEERRRRLERIRPEPPALVADIFDVSGPLWSFVIERAIEGIVAKRLGSPYRPGVRSPDWRKIAAFKNVRAMVIGFTAGEGGRTGTFGSLVLGLWDGQMLRPIGAVGSGFSDRSLRAIKQALDEMVVTALPVVGELPAGTTLVEPKLVAVVQYREWTTAGRLRAPSFKGFTDDPGEGVTWAEEGPPR